MVLFDYILFEVFFYKINFFPLKLSVIEIARLCKLAGLSNSEKKKKISSLNMRSFKIP